MKRRAAAKSRDRPRLLSPDVRGPNGAHLHLSRVGEDLDSGRCLVFGSAAWDERKTERCQSNEEATVAVFGMHCVLILKISKLYQHH